MDKRERCIVFTKKEMMFQCKSTFCRETVYNSELMDVFTIGGHNNPPEMWVHIIEYSGRQLSYKSDSLNGILGVFRLYSMDQAPVYHFWAFPSQPPMATAPPKSNSSSACAGYPHPTRPYTVTPNSVAAQSFRVGLGLGGKTCGGAKFRGGQRAFKAKGLRLGEIQQ